MKNKYVFCIAVLSVLSSGCRATPDSAVSTESETQHEIEVAIRDRTFYMVDSQYKSPFKDKSKVRKADFKRENARF